MGWGRDAEEFITALDTYNRITLQSRTHAHQWEGRGSISDGGEGGLSEGPDLISSLDPRWPDKDESVGS